jgi:[ribosomal protein S5]-alanine N-acetyltransferase
LADHRLIGVIHLMEIYPNHHSADVGLALNRAYWSQGFGREALLRVLAFSFAELKLHRIQGLPVFGNIAARRLAKTCGMIYEGTLRDTCFQKGAFRSFDVFSMLAGEFQDSLNTAPTRKTIHNF